jgi:hypothetical protein
MQPDRPEDEDEAFIGDEGGLHEGMEVIDDLEGTYGSLRAVRGPEMPRSWPPTHHDSSLAGMGEPGSEDDVVVDEDEDEDPSGAAAQLDDDSIQLFDGHTGEAEWSGGRRCVLL